MSISSPFRQVNPPLIAFALIAYSAVMVSLTMLKSFFVIGLLWKPEAHRNRSLSLQPFNDFLEAGSWFSPLFGYGGNFAFFVPFGVLLYALLRQSGKTNLLLKATLYGALFSLFIEVSQYVFMLGYSDIDDVIFNTLGALVGALIAKVFGPKFYVVWVWLAILLALIFIVLVVLGPRLGDPDKVVELSQSYVSLYP